MKVLNGKGYGSIAHLPGSRKFDRTDRGLTPGQVKILTEKTRDKNDLIIVQEKLDGSCVGVANIDGNLVPVNRAGYDCRSGTHEHHVHFAVWVDRNIEQFDILKSGQRLMGEWLGMAHSIKYDLSLHSPFVAFDLITGCRRHPWNEFLDVTKNRFHIPFIHHIGGPFPMDRVFEVIQTSMHFGEYAEGVVFRCIRSGEYDFLGKYVNQNHVCGKYFDNPVWLWRP